MSYSNRRRDAAALNEERRKLSRAVNFVNRAAAEAGVSLVGAEPEPPKGKFLLCFPVLVKYPGKELRADTIKLWSEKPIETPDEIIHVAQSLAPQIRAKDDETDLPEVTPILTAGIFVPQEVLDAQEAAKAAAAQGPQLYPETPSEVEPGTVDGSPGPDLQSIDPASPEAIEEPLLECAGCDEVIPYQQAEATNGLCAGCSAKTSAPGQALVTE